MYTKVDKLFEKKILLYGAGEMSNRVKKTLLKHDVDIEGYIDKRYEAYSEGYNQKRVYSMQEVSGFLDKEDYVVIVTVKNAYVHNEIAQDLKNIGFNFVIFKPLDILNSNECNPSLKVIMKQNSDITDGYTCDNWDLIDIQKFSITTYYEKSLYKREKDKVYTYVPAELIFYKLDSCDSLIDAAMVSSRMAVRMYEEFDRGNLLTDNKGLMSYVDEARSVSIINGMAVDDGWEKNFISGRLSVYHNMNRQYAMNPDFFRNSTANVVFHKPSFFEINSSAKNRVSFLMAKGNRFIPVTMSESDYSLYRNETVLKEAAKILDGTKLVFPIAHPYFMERETEADDYVRRWLVEIGRYLFDNKEFGSCLGKWIAKVSCADWGITYRYLLLLGLNVINTEDDDITGILNKLFYSENNSVEEDIKDAEILFYSNRIGSGVPVEELMTERVQLVFMQIWNEKRGAVEQMENKGFEKKCLFSTIWGDNMVKGYVFEKRQD